MPIWLIKEVTALGKVRDIIEQLRGKGGRHRGKKISRETALSNLKKLGKKRKWL